MPDAVEQPLTGKPARSLTGFYVALCIFMVLGLFGIWFWKAYNTWWFDADKARRRQVEAAMHLGLPIEKLADLGEGVKMELMLIPAGRFRMGSPVEEKGHCNDEPQHWVVIGQPFYIGKYEVTQEQWEKVVGTNPSKFKGQSNPVECASWDDCQDFLKKLNRMAKEKNQFRLPTEAEWEWACRAGTRTRFYFGDDEADCGDYAWYGGNSGDTTRPVGTRKPNAWGLYDLHGNVWEWCEDWYGWDYYAKSPRRDPTGLATGSERVLRGGCWENSPSMCRSSVRYGVAPATKYCYRFGLRVVVNWSNGSQSEPTGVKNRPGAGPGQ